MIIVANADHKTTLISSPKPLPVLVLGLDTFEVTDALPPIGNDFARATSWASSALCFSTNTDVIEG